MNIIKITIIIVLILINYNSGNIILALNDPNKDVECGDISGSSNQYFSVFNLASTISIQTPFSSTIANANLVNSITQPQSSSSINQSCEYYNSKNTIINAGVITLGDQAKNIINSLTVQHYLLFNGSVSVSKGSNINVKCNDLNSNSECFKTNSLDLSGKLILSNQMSNINVQSDINIFKTGLLTTSTSSTPDQLSSNSKITSKNNINNNGGLFQVNQPITIKSNLLNINSNGIMNINAYSSINSPVQVKGSSSLNVNYNTDITNDLSVYDDSKVNVLNMNSNSVFKAAIIKLDNIKSTFNSDGNGIISVSSFISNGLVNLNQSSIQVKSLFSLGSSSIVNILNEGGFFSNNNIDISGNGKVNMLNGYLGSNSGDFTLRDNCSFKTSGSTVNINSNFTTYGDSVFQSDDCKYFGFLALGLQLNDNSKVKFGNCKSIQLESINSVLSHNSQIQLSKMSKVLANSPFTLNDQSKLVIDESSQHTQSNKDIQLNDQSSISVSKKSAFMATDNVIFNLFGASSVNLENSSIMNLSKNSTLKLSGTSNLLVNNDSTLSLIGGKLLLNQNSTISSSDSEIEIANGSEMQIDGLSQLTNSKFNIDSSLIKLNGHLSLNQDSLTQIFSGEFSITSMGLLKLNGSTLKNHNVLNNIGTIHLVGLSNIFNNDGVVSLEGDGKIIYDENDNDDHIIYNNNLWNFSNNKDNNNLKKFINNGTINFSSNVNFKSLNTSINSIIQLLNSSISINNSWVHNGDIKGTGIINSNVYSSSNSSLGDKNSVSKITINGSLVQKLESEFHIVINGNQTEGQDYTIINILNSFNPNVDGKEIEMDSSGSNNKGSESTNLNNVNNSFKRSLLSYLLSSSLEKSNTSTNSNESVSSSSSSSSSDLEESGEEDLSNKQNKTINVYLNNNSTSGNITFLKCGNQSFQQDIHFKLKIHTFDPNTNTYKRIQDKCKYKIQQSKSSLSVLISPTKTCQVVVDSEGNPVLDSEGDPVINVNDTSILSSSTSTRDLVMAIVFSVVGLALVIGMIVFKSRKIRNFIKIKRESLRKLSH